jgi:hypothetical protein
LLTTSPAKAQSKVNIPRLAESVTVRIEGAIQGSGVLVEQKGGTGEARSRKINL